MIENFLKHESEFEALRAEFEADEKLIALGRDEIHYSDQIIQINSDLSGAERAGFTKARWAAYQRQLRDLGLAIIIKGKNGVEFRVDQGAISNGDSYKGYEYTLQRPQHEKPSLDNYRIFSGDRDRFGNYDVARPLKGNWYLYLFVNG